MSTRRFQLWGWEAINRHEGQLYLRRLRVVSCQWFGIYIHWFHASDDDCLHDHPWAFLTFILRGGYWEHTRSPNDGIVRRWHPPLAIRSRPAHWLHRVEIDSARKPVTIVLRGPRVRPWGFQTRAGWIPWPEYKDKKATSSQPVRLRQGYGGQVGSP
ncbi:MAG: hypothetical protein QF681_16045 [Vicinamibacterales bacterium]|jgi:hypothetical protein|nr:hypothetical protein [Vicinamibacterales bacterium]